MTFFAPHHKVLYQGFRVTSALGHKRTFCIAKVMSALLPKADMCSALVHVCFGPKADISSSGPWGDWLSHPPMMIATTTNAIPNAVRPKQASHGVESI